MTTKRCVRTVLLLVAALALAAPALAQPDPCKKLSDLKDLAKLGDLSRVGDLSKLAADMSAMAADIAESVAAAQVESLASLGELRQLRELGHLGAMPRAERLRLRSLARSGALGQQDRHASRRSGPQQTERVTKTFKVGPTGSLELANISGDIVVKAGAGDTIVIDAMKHTPQGADAQNQLNAVTIEATERAGRVEVDTKYPEHARNIRTSVDYTVTVPTGASVDLRSISGDIRVSGVKGAVRISECVSGDVTLEDVDRLETVKSVSGDVTVTRGAGNDVRVTTVSGDLTLRAVKVRSLEANTISGEVKVDDIAADRAAVKSMSGDVDYVGPFTRGGRYEFTSHSGDVRLMPTSNTGFEIDADTFSGEIRANMPITLKQGELQGHVRHEIRGTYGDGSALVTVRTFSGGVVIGKK